MANTLKFGNGEWYGKKDTILAYNDENNNYKPLPFDFSRASSATVINKNGLIETVGSGEPRIDYKDDSKGALLLEPSRTNLFLNSEPTSNENAAGGITYESFNWFLGFSNCIKFGDNSSLRFRYGATVSATTQHTISAFVIMDDLSEPLVGVSNVTGDFAFVCGGITGGVANENIYYGNNIYRVSTTLTSGANANNSGIIKYTSQSSKGFRVVGLQIEQGSYATSYIPTQGSAVTRLADNAYQQSVTQVIGQSEGTMFIEFIPKDSSTLQILYQAKSSSGVVGQIDIRLQSGLIRALANDGGGSQFFINGGSYVVGTKYKVAIRYKLNDSKLYINGTDSGSDTSCSFTGSSLDQVSFADSLSSFLPSVDIIDSRLYNTALTDQELQALTTI